jgi:5-methylcytosine-specific restriction endonuclease McrA
MEALSKKQRSAIKVAKMNKGLRVAKVLWALWKAEGTNPRLYPGPRPLAAFACRTLEKVDRAFSKTEAWDYLNLVADQVLALPRAVQTSAKVKREARKTVRRLAGAQFYATEEWKRLRYRALAKYGPECMCCGSKQKPMHVDHIKPRSKYPALELEFSNLQILCEPCNIGKSNLDETDWRKSANDDVPDDYLTAEFKAVIG